MSAPPALTDLDKKVRAFVYDYTMRDGLPPSLAQTTAALESAPQEIQASFQRLAEAHMLVLQKEAGEVLMANPFSAVPTPFLVRAGKQTYFGNYIWDAMGIPAMLKQDAVIQASCADCGTAMRLEIEKRFKDADDPLKLVIVRDMWLTGFDVPPPHTMYLDKPVRGHTLMQTIARVNRVFHDNPGGLVVDYLGIAEPLREALAAYTASGGKGTVVLDQDEAVAVLLEKYEIVCSLFDDFDWTAYFHGSSSERLAVIPMAMEHILSLEDGKVRLLQHVSELSKAFALAVPHPAALRIQDDVGFFQAVRAGFVKTTEHRDQRTREDLDHAVRQIISKAIAPEGVVDIFTAAGLPKPDISILSDEFLAGIRELPQKNLAVELLQRLINDEIKTRLRTNLVRSRSFAEMLEQALLRYQNRTIEAAQVINELIQIAMGLRLGDTHAQELGLTEEEIAFYDALAANESAVQVLRDETLAIIAREVLRIVRGNATIDWTVRENVRANLRRLVKRVLRKYGYPPDKQEIATQTVIQQAELMAGEWIQ